jgi:hypothetical protein
MRWALGFIAASSLVFITAACGGGGDDPQTLEEYLGLYEAADNRAEQASDQLDTQYAAVLSQTQLTDDNRPDVQAYFQELGEVGQTYVDEISDLNPPEEAEDLHEASVESYQHVLDLYDDAQADIGQVTSIGGLQALFDTPEINDALEAANEDCRELQQLATDNNVDVDLECTAAEASEDAPVD